MRKKLYPYHVTQQ